MQLVPSALAQTLLLRIQAFMETHVFHLEAANQLRKPLPKNPDWTTWQIDPCIEHLNQIARAEGLWNLFLPELNGLSHIDDAHTAEITGGSLLAPEIFNCNAPDTGNMEVIGKYGSEEKKRQWLSLLLDGTTRSVFCMTEPDIASSNATNLQATLQKDDNDIIINGTKWWSTRLGCANCQVAIFMGLSDTIAHKYLQHTLALVPLNTLGITIRCILPVFGSYDAPCMRLAVGPMKCIAA